MVVGNQRHVPVALTLGKTLATHDAGVWVGPRTGLDVCENTRPTSGCLKSSDILKRCI
jgi:hypothetical protein